MNDVLLNKCATITRCLQRIAEEFNDEVAFRQNYTQQDSVILNLQRACEASIDIANHLVRRYQLGIPQNSRDSFALLHQAHLLDADLALRLQKMIGLRNVAVHDYQALNLEIVISVVKHHLGDFARLLIVVQQLDMS